jgi:hypothetical protein
LPDGVSNAIKSTWMRLVRFDRQRYVLLSDVIESN